MKIDKGNRTVCFDVDDTLVFWSQPNDMKNDEWVNVNGEKLYPNKYVIDRIKRFKAIGYTVIVWSQSGHEWAEHAVKATNVEQYVDYIFTKPSYYYDDLDASHWMKRRPERPDKE